jgi:YidC/Oxa1 family membrane protein insertase
MGNIFTEVLYRPLFNIVVFLYNILPGNDFGLAIIVLTVLVRVIFLPLTIKTQRSQKALNDLNPRITEIKEKYKKDMQTQSAEIMKLYKENKVNPLAGCLPLLIQIPILIALYKAFIAGLNGESLNLLYSFIENPGQINPVSFGIIDITVKNRLLAVFAGLAQFIQMKQSSASMGAATKEAQALSRQMLYMFPIMIIIIGWTLPAGLIIYWIAATLASLAEQILIKRRFL